MIDSEHDKFFDRNYGYNLRIWRRFQILRCSNTVAVNKIGNGSMITKEKGKIAFLLIKFTSEATSEKLPFDTLTRLLVSTLSCYVDNITLQTLLVWEVQQEAVFFNCIKPHVTCILFLQGSSSAGLSVWKLWKLDAWGVFCFLILSHELGFLDPICHQTWIRTLCRLHARILTHDKYYRRLLFWMRCSRERMFGLLCSENSTTAAALFVSGRSSWVEVAKKKRFFFKILINIPIPDTASF